MQFKVPVTLVLGKLDNDIAFCVVEGRTVNIAKIAPEEVGLIPRELLDDLCELDVQDDVIRGHIALTSFGHSTIKAVDAGSSDGTCYITRSGELELLPTLMIRKSIIVSKDFGKWVNVLSLPIFLKNVLKRDEDTIVVAPSRLGENLHITIGYADVDTIRVLKKFLSLVRQLEGLSMVTTSCISRIPQIPLEICVIKEDKYLLFRTYLNSAYQPHTRIKLLLVIASGGNIQRRYISEKLDEKSLELVEKALIEFTKIAEIPAEQ